jgi:hypothetical protein
MRQHKIPETWDVRLTHALPAPVEGREDSTPRRRSRSFVHQISPSNLLLLKAALLEEDAAIAAYRAWRPTLDLATISYGQQRLLPLLQSNLTRFGIEDPLFDRFRGIRRYFWVRNLKAMAFAKRAFASLDEMGVPFIVLKGAALVACYLADRSLRPMDDIDILVPEKRLADAIAALTAINLDPEGISLGDLMLSSRNHHGWGFVGPDQNIDLHWKALHLDTRPEADDRFWQAHRGVCLDDMPIRVLDPAHQLIHICGHAAQPAAAAAAEQWPADAIMVIRGSTDLCVERLVSEAHERGLSAIMTEALALLAQEFNVSIPNALSRMRAAASWTERAEMHLLVDPPGTRTGKWLLELLDFRRRNPGRVSRSIASVMPAFLKSWAGVGHITPALTTAAQAILGRPGWLRRILGRDCYRILPDIDRLPKVGDTLELGGPEEKTALIDGWDTPEPTGCWTYGHEATIAWCVRGQDQDLTLLIDGIRASHEIAPIQRIDLWANDRRLASWRLQTASLPARILVPRALIRNRDVLMLTFLIRRPVCPVGTDMRSLYLRSLTLKVDQYSGNSDASESAGGPYT